MNGLLEYKKALNREQEQRQREQRARMAGLEKDKALFDKYLKKVHLDTRGYGFLCHPDERQKVYDHFWRICYHNTRDPLSINIAGDDYGYSWKMMEQVDRACWTGFVSTILILFAIKGLAQVLPTAISEQTYWLIPLPGIITLGQLLQNWGSKPRHKRLKEAAEAYAICWYMRETYDGDDFRPILAYYGYDDIKEDVIAVSPAPGTS